MCGLGGPSIPKPPPPVPPPQPSKAPEQETFKRKNIASARSSSATGNSGTILTGANGDAIPQGQLGTNTLLGG